MEKDDSGSTSRQGLHFYRSEFSQTGQAVLLPDILALKIFEVFAIRVQQ